MNQSRVTPVRVPENAQDSVYRAQVDEIRRNAERQAANNKGGRG